MVKYDVKKLNSLISDLSLVTGLDISVRDMSFSEIACSVHKTGLCSSIHKTKNGVELCRCSDELLLKKCRESGKPETGICHAGLSEIGVPVIKNGRILGYVMLGRIRGDADENSVREYAEKIGIEKCCFEGDYSELAHYDAERLAGVVNLVSAMTELILSGNMMREEYTKLSADIADFVENNLDGKLTVNILCAAMHISKNTLYEHFHYAFNTTVTDYITERRIERAKKLLTQTDMTLDGIAEACGIGSYTYLFKLMKKHTGMTPLEYRRK